MKKSQHNPTKSINIRESQHKELVELAEVSGQNISKLVDIALRNFLKEFGPILRSTATQINK